MNDFGFGQAPPGTMFITKEAFNPVMRGAEPVYSKGINERFAHEIAHQYWGHVVKMPSDEEQWLTESFAEYCAGSLPEAFKNEATLQHAGQALADRRRRGRRGRADPAGQPHRDRRRHLDPLMRSERA